MLFNEEEMSQFSVLFDEIINGPQLISQDHGGNLLMKLIQRTKYYGGATASFCYALDEFHRMLFYSKEDTVIGALDQIAMSLMKESPNGSPKWQFAFLLKNKVNEYYVNERSRNEPQEYSSYNQDKDSLIDWLKT